MLLHLFVAVVLASLAYAEIIRIDVGIVPESFTPDTTKADVGDTLEFHFHPGSHSVVRGEYTQPCAPVNDGGFFSGFVTVEAEEPVGFPPRGIGQRDEVAY
ncbi:hypothetical protein ACRALDRAFT_1063296 [Sodiomyces alcalophilus JCM 7366]|uniref:uncharacterized protein n=1 Tax=Sodiomyces alcalophilus JCM 7366 TaxID=591952 RepID=UPI0039B64D8A